MADFLFVHSWFSPLIKVRPISRGMAEGPYSGPSAGGLTAEDWLHPVDKPTSLKAHSLHNDGRELLKHRVNWEQGSDLNRRPCGYEPHALTGLRHPAINLTRMVWEGIL